VALLVLALSLLAADPAPQISTQDALTRGREALAALTAGRYSAIEARFTESMKRAYPGGRLAAMWTTLETGLGARKTCAAESRVVSIADKQMVITTCVFERASINVQFAFDGAGMISGMAFRPAPSAAAPYSPPAYAREGAYAEEDVRIGPPEWRLPATLTLPAGHGRSPALVLVHGSGPGDRDASAGANKPFKDLALGLASRGIAVLRYDKRSKVYPAKMAASPSRTVKDEVLDDAGAAIAALRADPRIDAARIFVLGHSLGGMLVPRIAAANPAIAGAIVLAGPARPLPDIVAEQARHLALLDGTISADEQAQIDAAPKQLLAAAPQSYWADLRGYDPPSAAAKLDVPLLVLQGERDYQVTMTDFERWKGALASRSTATLRSYTALNHQFIAGAGPSSPQEYLSASHVGEGVVRDIAAFIRPR
jgi:dienelactone hydrolase